MRRSLLSIIFLLGLSAPSLAQQCETMVLKNAAGAVISNSLMCAGSDGVWTPKAPAPPSIAPRRIEAPARIQAPARVQAPARIQPPAAVSGPARIQAPKAVTVKPQIVTPTPVQRPAVVAIEPVTVPIESVIIETPAPVFEAAPIYVEPPLAVTTPIITPTPTPSATGGQSVYAKLGLVCVAEQAMLCTSGSCGGLCAGKEGWCDGKTGEVYASREAIERIYCRKKRK